jgi:hypothetical protein
VYGSRASRLLEAGHPHVGSRPEPIDEKTSRPGEHMIFSTESSFRLYPSLLKVAILQFLRLFRRVPQLDSRELSLRRSEGLGQGGQEQQPDERQGGHKGATPKKCKAMMPRAIHAPRRITKPSQSPRGAFTS